MKMKLYTAGVVAALVMSSSGVIAYEQELLGGPSPVPVDSLLAAHPILVPGPRLSPIEEALLNPRKFKPVPPKHIDSETLWLARVIFSETKRPEEQVLVAWVVRNRVDTKYRGKDTYEGVILDPYQFSAFRPGSEKAILYASLTATSQVPGWQTALRIAYAVRHSEPLHRPFSARTRHFYSERSMNGPDAPEWALGMTPVDIGYESIDVEHDRFRFFEDVS
jgi:hypothetical protein